jgi:hypothetical protein
MTTLRAFPRSNLLASLAVCALATLGCSRTAPLDPSSPYSEVLAAGRTGLQASGYGSGSFYPLAIGNEWQYEGRISIVSFGAYPGPDGDTLAALEYSEHHEIVGEQEIGGRIYRTREERRVEAAPPDEHVIWSPMRQDRTGLFAADVDGSDPPPAASRSVETVPPAWSVALLGSGAATRSPRVGQALARLLARADVARRAVRGHQVAAGPDGDELVWLLYPLRPGQSWDIRPDFPWPARVDGIEILDTPAGRVPAYRIDTNPFGTTVGEGEWIRLYYGRRGYLGYSIHLVDPATSAGDAYFVFDDAMLLTSADLAR